MRNIFNTLERSRLIPTWNDFKTYINGTSASLLWNWTTDDTNSQYQIITEPYGGFNYLFWMPRTGSADQTDFENNFKNQGKAFATQVQEYAPPSFVVFASGATVGFKSMLSLFNSGANSNVVVKINKIFIRNTRNTTVTGIVGKFELSRIATHSAGAQLTIYPMDTNDVTSSNVTARVGATVTTSSFLDRWLFSTDEWVANTADAETISNTMSNLFPVYFSTPGMKPLTLRGNQGISLGFNSGSNTGFYDTIIYFTMTPA